MNSGSFCKFPTQEFTVSRQTRLTGLFPGPAASISQAPFKNHSSQSAEFTVPRRKALMLVFSQEPCLRDVSEARLGGGGGGGRVSVVCANSGHTKDSAVSVTALFL